MSVVVLQQYHSTNIAYCTTTYCNILGYCFFCLIWGKEGERKREGKGEIEGSKENKCITNYYFHVKTTKCQHFLVKD